MTRVLIAGAALVAALAMGLYALAESEVHPSTDIKAAALAPTSGLPGRDGTVAPTAYVVIELLSNGEWRYVDTPSSEIPTATSTPTPSTTDTATPTPSATPVDTSTPVPTSTPKATATVTPSPTATEAPFASPTPEQTQPPPTFTETPIPQDEHCIGTVISSTLTLRDGHTTASQRLAGLQQSEMVVIEQFHIYATAVHEWAYVYVPRLDKRGWVAAYYYTPVQRLLGWPDSTDESPWCDPPYVEVTYEGEPPVPSTPVAVGIHLSDGVPVQVIAESAPYMSLIKCTLFSGDNCVTYHQLNPAGVVIYRDTRAECPVRYEVENYPADYAKRLMNVWDNDNLYGVVTFYEIMNECASYQGANDYAALAAFFIQVAEIVNRERGVCVLVGGFGPGNPGIDEFAELYPFFEWALSHPCAPGRYHGISAHAAGYMPEGIDTSAYPWVGWIWVAGRHRLYNEALIQRYGFDLLNSPLPYIMTELGWTYGYSEDASAFTVDEYRAGITETARVYTEDGVDGFAVWNACSQCWGNGGTPWLNLAPYMPRLFW